MHNQELIKVAKSLVGGISLLDGKSSAGTVGAAILTINNNVYSGICLDYACGLGFCPKGYRFAYAEHAAVAEMLKHRETQILKIVAVNKEKVLPPCGRCRELIILTNSLNRNTEVLITESNTVRLSNLLPHHWSENQS